MSTGVPEWVAHVQSSPPVAQWAMEAAGEQDVVELAAGQVWRARLGTTRVLVMLVDGGARTWVMAPVALDDVHGDDLSLVVPADLSGVGRAATVWAGLQRPLATVVLERFLGAATAGVARWAATALSPVPSNTPARCRRGAALDLFDAGNAMAVALAEEMEVLAGAETLPEPGGPHLDQRTMLRGVDLGVLIDVLTISQSAAMDVLTGAQALTHDQAVTLSALTAFSVAELMSTPAPEPQAAFELEAPWNRAMVESLATVMDQSPLQVRALVARDDLTLAARVTGPRDDQTRARVRHVLQARIHDASQ